MLRIASVTRFAAPVARRSVAAVRPVAAVPRCFSVFAAEGPSDALSRLMKDRDTINTEILDNGIPLGAPKPSALNRIRMSGRSPEQVEARSNAAEAKLRLAQEYKEKRLAEKAKAEAEAAAAAKANKQ